MLQPSSTYRSPRLAVGSSSRRLTVQLLSRIAQDRSDAAFCSLFNEFAPRIKRSMLRQGADLASAEELAQETLLAVWRKARLYCPDKGSPTTWIYAIARNLRIDRLRRETAWQDLPDVQAEAIPADDALQDDVVAERQRRVRVQEVLTLLPTEQRQVVELAFIDGLSHGEIAERLCAPLGTVKSRMRLAYRKVRAALEDIR